MLPRASTAAKEIIAADQPTRFLLICAEQLRIWEEFRPRVVTYANACNNVRSGYRAVSRLSPAVRRLVTECELIESTLEGQAFWHVEEFVQEMNQADLLRVALSLVGGQAGQAPGAGGTDAHHPGDGST